MTKLNKMYYYTAKKEKKLNCYYVTIPKEMIEKAKLNEEIKLEIENDKIIIKNKEK
jgi:antitoxin component of MazEF toxin-antitoxin module